MEPSKPPMERPKRPRKGPPAYDPARIVSQWLSSIPADKMSCWEATGSTEAVLSASLPKRFIVYEPMVLFSPGAFADDAWKDVLGDSSEDEKNSLWKLVLGAVSRVQKSEVTHLAVNAGIPLHVSQAQGASAVDEAGENILRSPVQLQTLHGDFGPTMTENPPSEQDFEKAFWASTKQNGIFQTWAPRYTMFSRGNITEKARVLGYHTGAGAAPGLEHRRKPAASLRGSWAADLYAGIGYFTFSYAKLGMRVLCWEINPWSVEGLRRGTVKNGWRVRVVQGEDLGLPMGEVIGDEQIVVFIEDNRNALRRIEELRRVGEGLDILHVNGGLLPTSRDTWEDSWSMTRPSAECWLHLHENVGEDEIASRRIEIQDMFNMWAEREGCERKPLVEHVERVKTIAPRVWHCVFDVYIKRV